MVTAHWWPLETLDTNLAAMGCRCHFSWASDIVRQQRDVMPEVLPAAAPSPVDLYRLDHQCPTFVQSPPSALSRNNEFSVEQAMGRMPGGTE
jgi:hypothetical protein